VLLAGDAEARISAKLHRYRTPIALQVCQESRRHTLQNYYLLRHITSRAYSFYFNPSRDVVYLYPSLQSIPELQRGYGAQLGNIRSIMVEVHDWCFKTPAIYIREFIAPLGGIREIFIVLDRIDFRGKKINEIDLIKRAQQLRVQFLDLRETQQCGVEIIRFLVRNSRPC
jgi:hypothetical protein